MRVISQDGTINVPYESGVFCVINDEPKEEYCVAIRNNNLTGFMPLATYKSKKDAQKAFDDMIVAGAKSIIPNGTFQLM